MGEVGSIFGGVTVDALRGLALSLIGRPSDPTMRLALRELAELALSMVGGTAIEADEPRDMLMIGSPSDPVFLELLRRIDIAVQTRFALVHFPALFLIRSLQLLFGEGKQRTTSPTSGNLACVNTVGVRSTREKCRRRRAGCLLR